MRERRRFEILIEKNMNETERRKCFGASDQL